MPKILLQALFRKNPSQTISGYFFNIFSPMNFRVLASCGQKKVFNPIIVFNSILEWHDDIIIQGGIYGKS